MDVGVLLDGPRVPAWVAWILTEARARQTLIVTVVLVEDAAPLQRSPALFRLYESLDRRLFVTHPDALEWTDVSGIIDGAPRVQLRSQRRSEDVAELRRRDLDVFLWLGRAAPPEDVFTAARHGVWCYRHGDHRNGGPPLFWELFRAEPISENALESLDRERRRVIYRSTTSIDPVSLQRNRNAVYWKSARFAIRRLDDLASGRWRPEQEPGERRSLSAVTDGAPTNLETLRHAAAVAGRASRRKLQGAAFQHQWFLGFRRKPAHRLPYEDPAPWRVCLPPPDRSYADPFVVADGDDTLVFLEQIVHARARGSLAVGRLEPDGRLTDLEPLLPGGHHTSYPYVFSDAGGRFLIPEACAIRRVELFAATDFPIGWERVATLLEGVNAVDASVILHQGLYWMWVNIAVPGGRLAEETFVYLSDRLETGWTPHPRNPVVSDARRARPAGRPFLHEGRLIRPSQDCSGRYGARTVFNEVELLTPEEYREHPRGFLEPSWAPIPNLATHSYTFDGQWEATDGLRTFPRRLTSKVLRTIRSP